MDDTLTSEILLQTELAGLRSRLTNLRARSMHASTDLLAVLGPIPSKAPTVMRVSERPAPIQVEVVESAPLTPSKGMELFDF